MAIPDMFIKLLKETPDDCWDMGYLVHTLTNRRWKEKVIGYVESHDQAIVGDKTIAFWLMDAEMYTGMSLIQSKEPSLCIDRGLAMHKMLRLLVLGLGGEGYLNFMGNEFGHPEWIDFPTPANGWSHDHCRRRWDLADADHLRYQFFQCFDELMQACENRFKWLSSEHQYVCAKSEGDKVIAFERGELLFIFNLHPTKSFDNYAVGMGFNEPMRTVLDTDEGRFGGHMRCEHGHANAFKPGGGSHGRPHSVTMYLPARTAQVLIPAKYLEGGVKIHLSGAFLGNHGLATADGLQLVEKETVGKLSVEKARFRFSVEGMVCLEQSYAVEFDILDGQGKVLPCMTNFGCAEDPTFRAYFPGDYLVKGIGYLEFGKPAAGANLAADCAAQCKVLKEATSTSLLVFAKGA